MCNVTIVIVVFAFMLLLPCFIIYKLRLNILLLLLSFHIIVLYCVYPRDSSPACLPGILYRVFVYIYKTFSFFFFPFLFNCIMMYSLTYLLAFRLAGELVDSLAGLLAA